MSKGLIFYLKTLFVPCRENNFRPRALENQFFILWVGFVIGIKIFSVISYHEFLGADIFNAVSQGDIYTLTNEVRRENNIPELSVNPQLEAAAQSKLADMFRKSYFSHNSPQGVSPWYWIDRAGYDYQVAGENLAMNFFTSGEVVNAWLNSEAHRKNLLLKDFKDIGIAVGSGVINGQSTTVVVQMFGSPVHPRAAAKPVKVSISTAQPSPSPSPRASPISLGKVAAQVMGEKAAEGVAKENETKPQYKAYFSLIIIKDILIALAVVSMLMLILKIFVAIRIQYPALIAKAVFLIILCFLFLFLPDGRIFEGKIIIGTPDQIFNQ